MPAAGQGKEAEQLCPLGGDRPALHSDLCAAGRHGVPRVRSGCGDTQVPRVWSGCGDTRVGWGWGLWGAWAWAGAAGLRTGVRG